jgi:hypothetical protein
MGGGKSQRPDSTEGGDQVSAAKRGNSDTPGDRVEGSGASDHETSGRKYVGCMHGNPDNVSTKRRRIAELARSWAGVCVMIYKRVNA